MGISIRAKRILGFVLGWGGIRRSVGLKRGKSRCMFRGLQGRLILGVKDSQR
jgi:hypothetical protein